MKQALTIYHQFIDNFWGFFRLRHMKSKGMRQSRILSRNSEAIDMQKIACHQPSRGMVACDDYFLLEHHSLIFFYNGMYEL